MSYGILAPDPRGHAYVPVPGADTFPLLTGSVVGKLKSVAAAERALRDAQRRVAEGAELLRQARRDDLAASRHALTNGLPDPGPTRERATEEANAAARRAVVVRTAMLDQARRELVDVVRADGAALATGLTRAVKASTKKLQESLDAVEGLVKERELTRSLAGWVDQVRRDEGRLRPVSHAGAARFVNDFARLRLALGPTVADDEVADEMAVDQMAAAAG